MVQRMIEENSYIFNQREPVLEVSLYAPYCQLYAIPLTVPGMIFLYQLVLWHVGALLIPESPQHPHYTYTYTLISVTHFCIHSLSHTYTHTGTHCSESGITDLSALIL